MVAKEGMKWWRRKGCSGGEGRDAVEVKNITTKE